MTLNATPGDLNADSFVTLAEAEAYMGTVYHKDAWTALGQAGDPTGDAIKETLLRQATLMLGQLPWIGVRKVREQRLAWPRRSAVLTNFLASVAAGMLTDGEGYVLDPDAIPWQVKNAEVECAFRLISEDRTADAGALVPTNLTSGSTTISGLKRNPIPASVLDMLSPLLKFDPRGGGELVRA